MVVAYLVKALELDIVVTECSNIVIEGTDTTALLSIPENPNGVGVVLASSIWGLNQDLRSYVTFLSSFGFSVIAPNLFWRVRADHAIDYDFSQMSFLEHLNQVGDDVEGISDVRQALDELRRHASINSTVIIGWCYGGRIACKAAVEGDFDLLIGYYPTYLERHLDLADTISCKTALHLPEEEQWKTTEDCTAEIIRAFSPQQNVDVYFYPGVAHGFAFAPPHPQFNFAAARLCDARTLAYLLSETVEPWLGCRS